MGLAFPAYSTAQYASLSYLPPPPSQGASLIVPAGTSCAFVGTSGSGKSTIMRLLFRFYDVNNGSVRVGGTDVRDLKLDSLRSAIAQVPQARKWAECLMECADI